MSKKKVLITGLVLALFLVIIQFTNFYHCPINYFIGIPCPGCNIRTALNYLLRGDLQGSLWAHAMLIPTILVILSYPFFRNRQRVWEGILWSWAIIMLVYWVCRLVIYWNVPPMLWNNNAILLQVIRKVF